MILNNNENFILDQGEWSIYAGINDKKQWYVSVWRGELEQYFWFGSSSKRRAEVILDLMLMKSDTFE